MKCTYASEAISKSERSPKRGKEGDVGDSAKRWNGMYDSTSSGQAANPTSESAQLARLNNLLRTFLLMYVNTRDKEMQTL